MLKTVQKLCWLFLLLFISTSTFAQLSVGGGIASGTGNFYPFGVFGRAAYQINDKIAAAATLNYFFPKKVPSASTSYTQINLEGFYTLLDNDWLAAYGIGGVGYSRYSVKYDAPVLGTTKFSDGNFVINLGAGVRYKVSDKFVPFGEVRVPIVKNNTRLLVNIGVMVNL
jgi:outer membrane protein X